MDTYTIIELIIAIVLVIALVLYFIPKFFNSLKDAYYEKHGLFKEERRRNER